MPVRLGSEANCFFICYQPPLPASC
ncbi:AgrD family cyclic lactone autoinducer peptide [Brenneria goodwinii]